MPKQIIFDDLARKKLQTGANMVADTVKGTLGPRGQAVVLSRKWGPPAVIDDGATIAQEIELKDPMENLGAQLIKEAAAKTNDVAGDGTTTATLLAQSMLNEGIRQIAAGANATFIRRGMARAVEAVVEEIKRVQKAVVSREDIAQVASIASNDKNIGKMIADALEKVGREGVITVEEGKTAATELEVVEGLQFDRGWMSPYFVTDNERMEAVLEDAYVLLTDKKLSVLTELLPVLEKIAQTGKPFLVIAEDAESEILAALVVNKLRGILKGCAVKAPGFGDQRKEMLQDIAVLTGGSLISEDLGLKLENAEMEMLGRAKLIKVDKDHTTIIGGSGQKSEISQRSDNLRKQIRKTSSEYDRGKLEERLAKLTGGIAVINVGAATETEMKAKKSKVDDARSATKAAIEGGIIPGGGVTLLGCQKVLDHLKGENEDETGGIKIVRKALEAPISQMARNAGMEPSLVMREIRTGPFGYGFNAESGEYCDLLKAGIVDPAKVTRFALENAASVAGTILTTSVIVADMAENSKEPPAHSQDTGESF